MPAAVRRIELELVEDLLCDRLAFTARAAEFPGEPLAQLAVALVGVEDPADDQLRRGRPVPTVLLEPERDVVRAVAPVAVEPRAEAERDRAAAVDAVLADPEAQVLPLAHGRELRELAPGREQRDVRVAEPERREAA